jgi:hypothetical protein
MWCKQLIIFWRRLDSLHSQTSGTAMLTETTCPQVTQHDCSWSSAQLTLLLYGWDGADASFATLMYCLPHRGAGRVTLADKSVRMVSRAVNVVTPRHNGGGSGSGRSPSKSSVAGGGGSSLGRRSSACSSAALGGGDSHFDDVASHASGASASLAGGTPRRPPVHPNKVQ